MTNYRKYVFYHILFAVNHILKPFSIRSYILYYILIPNYTRLDLPHTTPSPFVSLILKLLATSFATRSLFGKSLNFSFTLFCIISKEFVSLSLKVVIIGIIDSKHPLINYLLLIAKLYLWDCRRTNMLPEIVSLKHKVKTEFEIRKYVNVKNNTLDKFKRK